MNSHRLPRLSEYERILREEFKFRKNLSADDWRRSIGPKIAKRKAEGKRSKVLLNGSEVQNVDRRIKRSLRSKSSHQSAKGQKQSLADKNTAYVPLLTRSSPYSGIALWVGYQDPIAATFNTCVFKYVGQEAPGQRDRRTRDTPTTYGVSYRHSS